MAFGSSGSGDINVKISGDASGLDNAFKQAGASTKSFSDSLKGVGTGLTLGVTAPLMAIGALALKSSADVGGAFSLIRQKTNETGAALDSLKTSFTNVWGNVTGDAKEVASAMSLIHQHTKLTGTGLEELTTSFSNLAKITQTPLIDVVGSATDAMNAWSIPTNAMSKNLDLLYAVTGRTGIGITELTSSLTTLQPTLEKLGFAFGPAASMIGDFEVAGLDATSMQKVFNKILNESQKSFEGAAESTTKAAKGTKKVATEAKDASTLFWEYVATIQTAKVGSKEYNEVMETLGGTMGTRFVNAVKKGVFNIKNFDGDLQSSSNAIKNAAADTMSFSDTMEIFGHKVEIGMKPLGSAITKTFLGAKPQMDAFAGGIQGLGKAFDKLPESVKKGIVLGGMFATALGPGIMAAATLGSSVSQMGQSIVPAFTGAAHAATGFAGKLIGIPGHLVGIAGKALNITGHLSHWGGHIATALSGLGGMGSAVSRVASGLVGAAGSALGMAGSVISMVPMWAVLAVAVGGIAIAGAGVVAFLVTAVATSQRFRDLLGELGGVAAGFAAHLGTAFSKITAGDWKGALDEIKVGLQEAWDRLKKIDWRTAFTTIGEEMKIGIRTGLTALKSFWENEFKPALISGIQSINWKDVGSTFGSLLKTALHSGLGFITGIFTGDWSGFEAAIAGISARELPGLQISARGLPSGKVGAAAAAAITTAAVPVRKEPGLAELGEEAWNDFVIGLNAGADNYFRGQFATDLQKAADGAGHIAINVTFDIIGHIGSMGVTGEGGKVGAEGTKPGFGGIKWPWDQPGFWKFTETAPGSLAAGIGEWWDNIKWPWDQPGFWDILGGGGGLGGGFAGINLQSIFQDIIPKFTWPSLPSFSWPSLPSFGWPSLPSFTWPALPTITWPTIPAFAWPSLPSFSWPSLPSITWPTIPAFAWPSLPSFSWPALPSFGWPSLPAFSWPAIPSINLGSWVTGFIWPSVPSIDLKGWVPSFHWPSISGINLASWIPSFKWPSISSINLASWIPSFKWPSISSINLASWIPSFSWPSIASINLANWIPAFPGWPALTGTGGLIGRGIQWAKDWAATKTAWLAKKAEDARQAAARLLGLSKPQAGTPAPKLGAAAAAAIATSAHAQGAIGFGGGQVRIIGEKGPEMVLPASLWPFVDPRVLNALPKLAGGAWITAGPQLAVLGEGREPEAVIPRKYWWGVDPIILKSLPKLQGGAITGTGGSPVFPGLKNSMAWMGDLSPELRMPGSILQKIFAGKEPRQMNVDRRIYVNGVKADEIASEIQRKTHIDELMYGDYC